MQIYIDVCLVLTSLQSDIKCVQLAYCRRCQIQGIFFIISGVILSWKSINLFSTDRELKEYSIKEKIYSIRIFRMTWNWNFYWNGFSITKVLRYVNLYRCNFDVLNYTQLKNCTSLRIGNFSVQLTKNVPNFVTAFHSFNSFIHSIF